MHLNQRQIFLDNVAQTSDAPLLLEITKAEGVYLHDSSGRKIIDLISGISVCNVGHSHPKIVQAVQQQAAQHMHLMVYGEVVQSPQVRYANLLAQNLPQNLQNIYFTNSGAEATEGALKLAKRYTGRSELVHFKNAYHGSTHGALSVMGDEYFKAAYRPLLPDTRELIYGDVNCLQEISCRTACVIIETIQAESGVTVPSFEFMQALRKRCDEVGALLILDEIQAGMGRTGTLFAFEHFNIVPDILLLAKAFGGGMPLGAFISSKEIMNVLTNNPVLGHITTFGGHPVCCAAGEAALNVLLEEKLIDSVEEKGRSFEKLLVHAAIKSVRRKGLLMALEFEIYEQNKRIIDRCIELGVFTDWFLFASNCLRIAPPLIIKQEEIKAACEIILKAIDEVS
jgi:acetylornithine/succinyldiaminopimelate/putrescine aminotransferase